MRAVVDRRGMDRVISSAVEGITMTEMPVQPTPKRREKNPFLKGNAVSVGS